MAKLESYRARLWSHALTETYRFWNHLRISTAIVSPVATAIFWIAIRGWKGWLELVYAILLGILIFFSGWGIVFIVSLAQAPVALDAESQETISNLKKQLELPDKALANHILDLLKNISENGKVVLKFLLFRDSPVGRAQITPEGLSTQEVSQALYECHKQTLVDQRTELVESGMPFRVGHATYYWIPEGFRLTLKRLLFDK